MLKDGARVHPAAESNNAAHAPATAMRHQPGLADIRNLFVMSGFLYVQKIAGLVSQGSQSGQQLSARRYISRARIRQSALR